MFRKKQERNYRFYGSKIVVYNEREKKLIVESNVYEEKNIIVAGCLRIDEIIKEPLGGAHRDPAKMADSIKHNLVENLTYLNKLPLDDLLEQRYQRWVSVGRDEN